MIPTRQGYIAPFYLPQGLRDLSLTSWICGTQVKTQLVFGKFVRTIYPACKQPRTHY